MPTRLTRRQFLALSAGSAATLATGCATNPVTGRRQLMFLSESMEINLDRRWAPHQFSADYGPAQDEALNRYLAELCAQMAQHTHRPHMPYSARVVNSPVVNAYTFPGGSMGYARGLLLALNSEAELAAVMGHEMGHVSARHAGARQTTGLVAQMLVAGVSVYMEIEHRDYAFLAAGLGALGAYALLSRYSRDNEREADKLGMEYAVLSGYRPHGMVEVMDVFRSLSKRRPGPIEILFATHPMSEERYDRAARRTGRYRHAFDQKEGRERYQDRIAGLRKIAPAIEALQDGQTALRNKKPEQADTAFRIALGHAPQDYAALTMMAKGQLAMKRHKEALRYALEARAAYPQEPQAWHVSGLARVHTRQFEAALADFSDYEKTLPGNPNTIFYRGYCLDKMDRREPAAEEYARYLRAAPNGEFSAWTRGRLEEWDQSEPAPQPQPKDSPK